MPCLVNIEEPGNIISHACSLQIQGDPSDQQHQHGTNTSLGNFVLSAYTGNSVRCNLVRYRATRHFHVTPHSRHGVPGQCTCAKKNQLRFYRDMDSVVQICVCLRASPLPAPTLTSSDLLVSIYVSTSNMYLMSI